MMKKCLEKIRSLPSLPVLVVMLLAAAVMLAGGGESASGDMTAEEKRLSRTLSSIAGAGECRVSVWYENESSFSGTARPTGALIVSAGAGDLSVRLQLMQAAGTLLGLEENQIAVYLMEEEK